MRQVVAVDRTCRTSFVISRVARTIRQRGCATLITVDLTDVEQRLIDHVVDGTRVDLAPESTDEDIDENLMRAWDQSHRARAEVVRDILRGRYLPNDGPAPRALRLRGAWILGRIDLDGITTTIRLQLSSCFLPDGLDGRECVIPRLGLDRSVIAVSSGHGEEGAVRLEGAHITGQLVMSGATLTNETGPALYADSATVVGNVLLNDTFTARGHGERGAVSLLVAHITGQLDMAGATLTNEAGPALAADGVIVDADAFLDGAFTASGHGEIGAVRLPGAHITGQLSMSGATLTNETGPALHADGVIVDGGAILTGKFTASGHGEDGAVRLPGAHITGQLVMSGATLTNETGPALLADSLTVVDDAFLNGTFTARGHSAVRLQGAHITGHLEVNDAEVARGGTGANWIVDGLTYDGYPSVGFDKWLELLQYGTPEYRPQPYRQLAAAARAAGHDDDARRALMTQRDDQVKRGDLTAPEKAWARFTKFTLGYGYQPWRALVGIALVLLAALIIAFFIPDALAHEGGAECTRAEKLQIAVDVAIPLVSTSSDTPCHVTATPAGQFVAGCSVFLTLFGWALTALFAAGFTRAIRQP